MPLKSNDLYEIQEGPDVIYNSLQTKGFFEIGNRNFLTIDYEELYDSFDHFIELMRKNKEFSTQMYELEKEFLSIEEYKKQYCSAPPSYRDQQEHQHKRFKKAYFQFIQEHYDLIQKKYPALLALNPWAKVFLAKLHQLNEMSKEIFEKVIESLDKSMPGIQTTLYGQYKELTVISRIICYEKDNDTWGTVPHRDKSALTLIWNSDDDNDDSLILCEDIQNPKIEHLKRLNRTYDCKSNQITSTILVAGAVLDKLGIDLKAAVHGVMPIKNNCRHAIVTFLLIPDIDMTNIIPDFIEQPESNL